MRYQKRPYLAKAEATKMLPFLFVAGYSFIWMYGLYAYLPPASISFILGALAMSFTLGQEKTTTLPVPYFVLATLFLMLSFFVPVKTLLFLSFGFAILFLYESYFGTVGFLSVCTLVFMAPAFEYAANVFSFPIRLQLTSWAGYLFTWANVNATVKGNMIVYNGNEFSVDPACMGLSMLITSLLLGSILVGYYQKKYGRILNPPLLLLCYGSILVLNVISNLLRIIILVHFHILPGDAMHDLVGLICLLVYVLLPMVFLCRKGVEAWGKATVPSKYVQNRTKGFFVSNLFLLLAVGSIAYRVAHTETYKAFDKVPETVVDYKARVFAPGIVKLENNRALAYVKFVRGFYDTDHNPTICWKGSGYNFEQVQTTFRNGYSIYTALLVKGNEKLYTAWWYSNGRQQHTSDPIAWRWHMLQKKETYALVNVTAASQNDLHKEVERIISHQLFSHLFRKL